MSDFSVVRMNLFTCVSRFVIHVWVLNVCKNVRFVFVCYCVLRYLVVYNWFVLLICVCLFSCFFHFPLIFFFLLITNLKKASFLSKKKLKSSTLRFNFVAIH